LGGDSFGKPPESIVTAEIDPTTGLLVTEKCPAKRTEYFIEGTQPQENCEAHEEEDPDSTFIPGFSWPEDKTDMPEATKKLLREADKAVEDAQREVKKQIKKAGKN
jgi:membrane carboxypeptidase/penicillin-binding protein